MGFDGEDIFGGNGGEEDIVNFMFSPWTEFFINDFVSEIKVGVGI